MSGNGTVRIAAVGDLHVREDGATAFRALLAEMCAAADVLVFCGDLTDMGKRSEAEVLRDALRPCATPVVAVLGNHDFECGAVDEVRAALKDARVHLLDGESCEIHGVGFAGVKGFLGGFGRRMLGSFGEPAIKTIVAETIAETVRLENALHNLSTDRVVVALHYSPIAETLEGEPPELLPFLGCSRFAETIDRFRVDAVFHGHAHKGKFAGHTPGGIPVYNVAWPIAKPEGRDFALIEV
jgi:Icc-related predicted phosphoesterase